MGRGNNQAKRRDETDLQWRSRLARDRQEERDKASPLVSIEAQRHSKYGRAFVTHAETGTKADTYRNELPTVVDAWFLARHPGFEEPARKAIDTCLTLWEARPLIGKLCASYKQTIPGGGSHDYGILDALDDTRMLDKWQAMFHPAHWRTFENVVRWGHPAGRAGSGMENNPAQSIAAARAVVGLVANVIAARMGY